MYPAWILPAAPKLEGRLITHKLEEDDAKHSPPANLAAYFLRARKRHEEWKRLKEMGYTPAQIADKYLVSERAVRHVVKIGATGPTVRRPLVVDGKHYESQDACFKALRIRKPGLRKLIESGRAKYVR